MTISISKIVGRGYDDFWTWKGFYRVCKGSKGSKKSKTSALWYIYHMMKYPDANTLVIRRFYRTIMDSCVADLLWAMDKLGVSHLWKLTKNPSIEMVYIPTGQKILFRGLDKAEKLASVSVPKGILCWVWFEEAYEVANEAEFDKIAMSIRGRIPPETGLWKQITLTFNPWSEHTWLKSRFFDNPKPNVLAKTTTFRDNEFLDDVDVQRYLDMYQDNPRAARVICDGDWGVAEGLIYNNWEVLDFDIDELKRDPNIKHAYGLDFGYAASYNAFVAIAADIGKRKLWIYDEMYEKGLTNIDIAKKVTAMGYSKEIIWADAAEPKSIYELEAGLIEERVSDEGDVDYHRWQLPSIRPALKGPDSVANGIQRLQAFRIYVHPSCKNVIMELNNYCYDVDKDGNFTDKPIKDFDHCLVAGTMVLTDHGQVPIEDIHVGDLVMTHLGYMPVEAAGITQLEAEIWRLECEDGTILEGTWNHPVLTRDGLKYLGGVSEGDEVIKWQGLEDPVKNPLMHVLSNMMDINGTDIPMQRITPPESIIGPTSEAGPSCITDICGNNTMAQSQKDAISITSTGILSTMTYPISNASLPKSMLQSILGTMSAEGQSETVCVETAPTRRDAGNGTSLKRDIDGMSSTGTGSQRRSSPVVTPVSTVERYSRLNLTAQSSSAPTDAELLLEEHPESITRTVFARYVGRHTLSTNTRSRDSAPMPAPVCTSTVSDAIAEVASNVAPVRVKSVIRTGRREVVYDLTVAVSHDFFANNLITANCMDAIRYASTAWFITGKGYVAEAKGGRPSQVSGRSKRVVSSTPSV